MIAEALIALRPNAEWTLNGDTLDGLSWYDTIQDRPTDAIIIEKATELQNRLLSLAYQDKRRMEYPPLEDFADAWVKNDQVALEEYRQSCLAVKAKYPKP